MFAQMNNHMLKILNFNIFISVWFLFKFSKFLFNVLFVCYNIIIISQFSNNILYFNFPIIINFSKYILNKRIKCKQIYAKVLVSIEDKL